MKYFILLTCLAISFIAFSCGQYDNQNYGYDNEYAMDEYDTHFERMAEIRAMEEERFDDFSETNQNIRNEYAQKVTQRNNQSYQNVNQSSRQQYSVSGSRNGIKMFPIMDPQTGMVSSYMPLPASWRVAPDKWTSPGRSEVTLRKGIQLNASVNSIDQVIQQIIIPAFRQDGVRADKVVDLPAVRQADQKEQDGYFSYGNAQNFVQAKGIELTQTSTGNKAFIVVHFLVKRNQYHQIPSYWFHVLGAGAGGSFEKDKDALIYALANFKMNPQWVAAHNRQVQGQLASNDARFQQKQKENWDHFNRMQDINRTNSSVGDIYHDMYKNTSAMKDRGQERAVNGIHERNAMVNPYSGEQINLGNNYKYYYMNQFGQYFGTNDEFYNPERDPNVNHQEWRKVQYRGN